VARGEPVEMKPRFFRKTGKHAEFHFLVASDARIGRPARTIFLFKILKDDLLVLLGAVYHMIVDAERFAQGLCLFNVPTLFRPVAGVSFGRVPGSIAAPELHGQAHDIMPLLFQKKRSDRRIDPSAHADGYFHRVEIYVPAENYENFHYKAEPETEFNKGEEF
jgi:hypothetical protein